MPLPVLALLLTTLAAPNPVPIVPTAAALDEASWRKSIEEYRAGQQSWLRSDPTSYLAAVGRVPFGEKSVLAVGSAPGNDLVLDGLRPAHLRVTATKDGFAVAALDDGATFTLGKDPAPRREAATGPALVGLGRFRLRLSHQGHPALIVLDAESPRFREFHEIPYFPIDPAYRFVVPLVRDPKPRTTAIGSTASASRRAVREGWFSFVVGGRKVRVAVHRLLEPGSTADSLSVFFRDATTGKESYAVGRYVEPEKRSDGTWLLDFNRAYSPACAYSSHYNCPIPPAENELPVAIRAGEKDPGFH